MVCQESSVASAVGTTLSGTSYKIYGLTVPQSNFEDIMNQTANEEANIYSLAFGNQSDPVIGPALIAFQVADCAYRVVLAMPGYAAVYFSSGVGDTRFDPSVLVTFLNAQADRYLTIRDRAARSLQNILESGTGTQDMISTNQPGYGQPSAPFYAFNQPQRLPLIISPIVERETPNSRAKAPPEFGRKLLYLFSGLYLRLISRTCPAVNL